MVLNVLAVGWLAFETVNIPDLAAARPHGR
jgi:hypothetical protein